MGYRSRSSGHAGQNDDPVLKQRMEGQALKKEKTLSAKKACSIMSEEVQTCPCLTVGTLPGVLHWAVFPVRSSGDCI